MKKFSLLIAHFNNFKYFEKCYQSVLSQTYSNLEIIILDDCSTDNSLFHIKHLTKNNPNVKIFENETNEGVGSTKRKCVEMATGDICGFLDPDDALIDDAISISVQNFSNKNIVATYSQLYLCDRNLEIEKIFPNSQSIRNNNVKFLNINFEVAHFFCFLKSAYLKTAGINENYKVAEDQDLILKIYEQGSFKFIATPLYYYRVHEKGISHDKSQIDLRQKTWDTVLRNVLHRRKVSKLYNTKVSKIENIPSFIFKKQNTLISKILRKLSW